MEYLSSKDTLKYVVIFDNTYPWYLILCYNGSIIDITMNSIAKFSDKADNHAK